MTKCSIVIDGEDCALQMVGHATGSEIVCAACSAIAYTLAGYLTNAEEHIKSKPIIVMGEGNALIGCAGDECVQAVFRAAAIGLMQIEAKSPEYCSVRLRERQNVGRERKKVTPQ